MNCKHRVKTCYKCGRKFIVKGKSDLYCETCRDVEAAKDMKLFKTASGDDIVRIYGAILKQAARDYVELVKKYHRAYDNDIKRNYFIELQTFSRWWKGKDFQMLAFSLNGAKIQRELNRQIYAEIREKREGKKKFKRKPKPNNV